MKRFVKYVAIGLAVLSIIPLLYFSTNSKNEILDDYIEFSATFFSESKLEINISEENHKLVLDEIKKYRKQALIYPKPPYHSIEQIIENDTLIGKLRLKGDWSTHVKTDKWSFRVKLKSGKEFLGCNKFSLHSPKFREGMYEWYFLKFLEYNDILAVEYYFTDVSINGEHKGVYAVEEHFEGNFLQKRNLNGCILKYNEDSLWTGKRFKDEIYGDFRNRMFWVSGSECFTPPTTVSKTIINAGIRKLQLLKADTIELSKLIDIDKTARYYAACEAFGATHSLAWHNRRFYYNPATQLLEPIGFDGNAGQYFNEPFNQNLLDFTDFQKRFSSDSVFMETYRSYLNDFCDSEYLNQFFATIPMTNTQQFVADYFEENIIKHAKFKE